jgi:DNA recombination protein RmuC
VRAIVVSGFIQLKSDFVLLFIPIRPAFAMALNEDTTLYNKFRNIVIVTPATFTLRTIDSVWANQKNNEMLLKANRAYMYDKFEGFVTDLIGGK